MPRSLDLLPHQPIRFGLTPETCANNDNRAYCRLVQDGDEIKWQVRRILGTEIETCGMTEVDSTNLVVNPGFTGSAASWSLVGGFSYAANQVSITAATGTVSQNIGVSVGSYYKVEVVTNLSTTGDDMDVSLSGTALGVIPDGSVAGTYTFYGLVTGGTGAILLSGSSFTTAVTTVNVYQVAPCFGYDLTSGTLTFDETSGFTLENATVIIDLQPTWAAASIYSPKVTVHVRDYIGGTIQFNYNADLSEVFPGSNGATTWTGNDPLNTGIAISLTDFTGIITAIEVEQLSSDYVFTLNALDGTEIDNIDDKVTYCGEYINGTIDPEADGIDYGCFMIGIYDPFVSYGYNLDFTSGCINYQPTHDCTKIIKAIPGINMGFDSTNCDFEFIERFKVVRIMPNYKMAGSDFISSDGTRVVISGTLQKFSTFFFDYMDEAAHDFVAALAMCREIYVGEELTDIETDGTRYFALVQDYAPDYPDKNGKYNLSTGRIEMMEYDQVKFTTNCGN